MKITVELPSNFSDRPDPARDALEALAIAGFQSGALTAFQASRLLGFTSRFEFDAFLKQHNVFDHSYSADDLEEDMRALEILETKQNARRTV